MKHLVIVGAKQHAKVVKATLDDSPMSHEWSVIGFLDDNPSLQGTSLLGRPILGRTDLLEELARSNRVQGALVGISCGHMPLRARLFERIRALGLETPTVISPTAHVHHLATLGPGSVVCSGAIIHAFATVGGNFVAYANATVEHECVLHDNVYLGPGVNFCAEVEVGANTHIGTGANVICERVGRDVIVGAGSAVIRNVEDGWVVAGVPAKPLRMRDAEARQSSYALRKASGPV